MPQLMHVFQLGNQLISRGRLLQVTDPYILQVFQLFRHPDQSRVLYGDLPLPLDVLPPGSQLCGFADRLEVVAAPVTSLDSWALTDYFLRTVLIELVVAVESQAP